MNASTLRPRVDAELAAARAATDRATAWHHLERAHVLSQPSPWLHTRVHAVMLAAGFADRDPREVFGQLVRIAVAGIASALGRYPAGNTGRARMPLTARSPAPSRSAR